jgi:hypothetical protein
MRTDVHWSSSAPLANEDIHCFKSWTAYVGPTAAAAIAVPVVIASMWRLESTILTFVVVLIILGAYAASVLRLQEDVLMIDDEGVWYCRGGLGTRSRIVGVQWRHVRCSLSRPRRSWSRTSCTVVIRNRMTCREIVIEHMALGELAVARIDSLQQARLPHTR